MRRSRYLALALLTVLGLVPALTAGAADTHQVVRASEIIRSTVMILIVDCQTTGASAANPMGVPTLKTCDVLGNGSGTIIQADGQILTNAHVVFADDLSAKSKPYWTVVCLTLSSRQQPQPAFFAKPVRFDKTLDLAVIAPAYKLDGTPIKPGEVALPPLTLAKSTSNLDVEDDIRLIGYPGAGGALITVIQSKIVGFLDDKVVPQLGNSAWIKAEPPSGPGVSGGTAVDDSGTLIGIPTQGSGGDIRCADLNNDGKVDPSSECITMGGEQMYVRPIEGYNLLMQESGQQSEPNNPGPQPTPSLPSPQPTPAQPAPVPTQPAPAPQPSTGTAILTGTLVSADTGSPIAGGYFLVLKPGVDFAKFKSDSGSKEDVFSLGISNGSGIFQVAEPLQRGQPYSVAVIAQGYQVVYQDGLVIPTDAAGVIDLGKIEVPSQT